MTYSLAPLSSANPYSLYPIYSNTGPTSVVDPLAAGLLTRATKGSTERLNPAVIDRINGDDAGAYEVRMTNFTGGHHADVIDVGGDARLLRLMFGDGEHEDAGLLMEVFRPPRQAYWDEHVSRCNEPEHDDDDGDDDDGGSEDCAREGKYVAWERDSSILLRSAAPEVTRQVRSINAMLLQEYAYLNFAGVLGGQTRTDRLIVRYSGWIVSHSTGQHKFMFSDRYMSGSFEDGGIRLAVGWEVLVDQFDGQSPDPYGQVYMVAGVFYRFDCEVLEAHDLSATLEWRLPGSYTYQEVTSEHFRVNLVPPTGASHAMELKPYILRVVPIWRELPKEALLGSELRIELGSAAVQRGDAQQSDTNAAWASEVFQHPGSHWGLQADLTVAAPMTLQGAAVEGATEMGAVLLAVGPASSSSWSSVEPAAAICGVGTW